VPSVNWRPNIWRKQKELFQRREIPVIRKEKAGMALLRAYRALPKYRPLIKFLSEEGRKGKPAKAENFYMQEQSKNMHMVPMSRYTLPSMKKTGM
jgi:preprotein translocase subunit SecA